MTDWRTSSAPTSRLTAARAGLPAGALELASHAAVPVALDAAFLNLLRVNFFVDPPLVLPFEVEADLLTSPLFREVGEGLYEIDGELRNLLLVSLVSRFGSRRLAQVATLLEQYTDRTAAWRSHPELEHAQRLTALSLVDPAAARRWLDTARSSVAGAALGREWFVAMGTRLDAQPDPSSTVDDEVALLRNDSSVAAVHRLGQLALLPGADAARIVEILHRVSTGPAADVAGAVVRTLTLLIPPPSEPRAPTGREATPSLPTLLGIPDPGRLDLRRSWAPRSNRDRLRVPIGVDSERRPVLLDLKEAAQEGLGPHGLIVGATGSGKTELLHTIVLALAATHSPDTFNVAFVDYKGSATFRSLERLPHVSAVMTGLFDDMSLPGRMVRAVSGEMRHRQQLLTAAGDFANRFGYERARANGQPLEPMPTLLIVCDEFTELLAVNPDIIDLFVEVCRVGRSLGIHLLLASQRLEQPRLRGLDIHMSYRVALRTDSGQESLDMVGVPDARLLPPTEPGTGYLRTDWPQTPTRFRAAYVSGPYRERPRSWDEFLDDTPVSGRTVADVLVAQMEREPIRARPIWLPPLDRPLTVDQALSLPVETSHRAWLVRVGIEDDPFECRQEPVWLDLIGVDAHVIVVGEWGSGRTTFLQTVIATIAVTHTPEEAQFYCLALGNAGLVAIEGLPHVGTVATAADVHLVRRTVKHVRSLLSGRPTEAGHVFLVVDDWFRLQHEFRDLEPLVDEVVTNGGRHNVHVVAAGTHWAEVQPEHRTFFGNKVELRLGRPAGSAIDPRAAAEVPYGRPGRGLTSAGLHFLANLPRVDSRQTTDDLADGLAHLVRTVRETWPGPGATPVRPLPDVVPFDELPPSPGPGRIPIGVVDTDLLPVVLDLNTAPHLLVTGDEGSGRTSFLRAFILAVTQAYEQPVVFVVDPLGGLYGQVEDVHYARSAVDPVRLIEPVRANAQLRPTFVIVNGRLAPDLLLGLINDLGPVPGAGVHVVLSRRTTGASRIMSDPIVSEMRTHGLQGLIMSGSPDEGPLLGDVTPEPMPPGRAWLVTPGQANRLVQLAWLPPGDG